MPPIIPYNPNLKQLARKLRKNMTFGEVLLWNELKENQILGFDFDRQRCIDNYIVDFYCKHLKLALEVDGTSHNSEEAFAKDEIRQKRLEELGVVFLRFSEHEIKYDMANVLRSIESTIIKMLRENKSIKPPAGFDVDLLNDY